MTTVVDSGRLTSRAGQVVRASPTACLTGRDKGNATCRPVEVGRHFRRHLGPTDVAIGYYILMSLCDTVDPGCGPLKRLHNGGRETERQRGKGQEIISDVILIACWCVPIEPQSRNADNLVISTQTPSQSAAEERHVRVCFERQAANMSALVATSTDCMTIDNENETRVK